ncbi:DUF732 domain-containing protein [Mycobacterium shigaense]|uniref:DUF732 domain-containing protein n=1 Tax=Mycobacterium shigaense TaxID=722731 RepID=A0A1Z4EPG6_9MYCO|nr:DUF732 domain-containing protein [Mycobacterium shigaense]MEA1121733.1 DUF732 domain-containing protein [Mycobacterium shigaense]PRI15030.1 hypothetical protein B2J96_11295 [Mycobacterium shigaense]BAX94859.1 hypothetical protein MSG_04749 [Mycobacterium shigaense]
MSRLTVISTAALALSALLLPAPAVASAAPDSTSAYLATLSQYNVPYKDPLQIVQIGTALCHDLHHDNGDPQPAVQKIQNSGYTPQQAGVIAATAVLSFCPDMNEDTKKASKS